MMPSPTIPALAEIAFRAAGQHAETEADARNICLFLDSAARARLRTAIASAQGAYRLGMHDAERSVHDAERELLAGLLEARAAGRLDETLIDTVLDRHRDLLIP